MARLWINSKVATLDRYGANGDNEVVGWQDIPERKWLRCIQTRMENVSQFCGEGVRVCSGDDSFFGVVSSGQQEKLVLLLIGWQRVYMC